MILNKKYEKQKIKKFGNIKKNFRYSQEKTNELAKSTLYDKSPGQKSFIMNKNRNQKSNDIHYTKILDNELDEMNFMLTSENDLFSRSVIFSNNKRIENNLFPPIKKKKIYDITNKKNPRIKMFNRNLDDTRKKIGMARSVKNTNIKKKKDNNLNISDDYIGVSKFDEKYQLFEDKIIDKNYENDIDHDEMIISNKKGNNALFSNVQISSRNSNKDDEDDDLYFYFEKNNKDNNEDEYLINNNFENNKNDFCIMYIDNYEQMINDDMLLLEIQLLYEKILDLQNSYHEEYDTIFNQFNKNKKFISLIIYKYKEIQKKNFTMLKIKENNNFKNKYNNFYSIQEKEHKSYISEINNKEINLWKNMLGIHFKKRNNNMSDEKKEIKDLFKKIVFNKYTYIKNDLNDIENKIVLNLMKKYNYKIMLDKKNKSYVNGVIITGNNKNKNNKMAKTKLNHKIINSGSIYDNKQRNYFKNLKYNNYTSSKKKGY